MPSCPAQVVGQRPHVEPGRHPHRQGGAVAVERRAASSCVHLDRRPAPGRASRRPRGAPGGRRGLAADFLGGVGRRRLRKAPRNCASAAASASAGGALRRLGRGLAGGVVGVGVAAERDRRLVGFSSPTIRNCASRVARPTHQRQHAGGHRIQRAGVADPALAERAPRHRPPCRARWALRLVDDEHAVDVIARLTASRPPQPRRREKWRDLLDACPAQPQPAAFMCPPPPNVPGDGADVGRALGAQADAPVARRRDSLKNATACTSFTDERKVDQALGVVVGAAGGRRHRRRDRQQRDPRPSASIGHPVSTVPKMRTRASGCCRNGCGQSTPDRRPAATQRAAISKVRGVMCEKWNEPVSVRIAR